MLALCHVAGFDATEIGRELGCRRRASNPDSLACSSASDRSSQAPDTTFDTLFTARLRQYAEAGVRPIDRFAIAQRTIAGGAVGSALGVPRLLLGRQPLVLILIGFSRSPCSAGTIVVGS